MNSLIAFVVGLIFGLGLLLSGMANPAKVLSFLDVLGAWDPSLMLVMVGAIAVSSGAFFWVKQRGRTLLDTPLHLPTRRELDRRLILGSIVFGVGWGLAGFCPGPAWVALGLGEPKAWGFVAAMLAGMAWFEWRGA
jgi:uncharacterized membrane protein YedE/YeeE